MSDAEVAGRRDEGGGVMVLKQAWVPPDDEPVQITPFAHYAQYVNFARNVRSPPCPAGQFWNGSACIGLIGDWCADYCIEAKGGFYCGDEKDPRYMARHPPRQAAIPCPSDPPQGLCQNPNALNHGQKRPCKFLQKCPQYNPADPKEPDGSCKIVWTGWPGNPDTPCCEGWNEDY